MSTDRHLQVMFAILHNAKSKTSRLDQRLDGKKCAHTTRPPPQNHTRWKLHCNKMIHGNVPSKYKCDCLFLFIAAMPHVLHATRTAQDATCATCTSLLRCMLGGQLMTPKNNIRKLHHHACPKYRPHTPHLHAIAAEHKQYNTKQYVSIERAPSSPMLSTGSQCDPSCYASHDKGDLGPSPPHVRAAAPPYFHIQPTHHLYLS
mmetsp:Transcript_5956/g.13044  ORF Transcript_5956/g.13044 Transcript_5956/m.13044 type:complete len:203 (+) Transcript_5956:474-1082(+)